jgi:hypothetical protein
MTHTASADEELVAELELLASQEMECVPSNSFDEPDSWKHTKVSLALANAADAITRLTGERDEALEALKPMADEAKKRPWYRSHLDSEIGGSRLTNRELDRAALIIAKHEKPTGKIERIE